MSIKVKPISMTNKVLIFTKRVLPLSNTFVAAQGNNLPNFQPIYIGLRGNKSGIDLIDGQSTCVQEKYEALPLMSRLMLDGIQYLTPAWKVALSDLSASLIHAHFGKGGYYCSPIAQKLNIPLITTFHGSDITQKDKFSYNKKHRKVAFQQSSKIIAVSKFIENKLLEGGCPPEKIIQHYIGIDTQYFTSIGKKEEQPTILFVGRLIEQKGCQYLIQAMKIVQTQLPEAELIIAGAGNYQDKLLALTADLKNICFVGAKNRAQVKALMSSAWLTCLPSIKMDRGNEEGMPTVCMESQAMGTPVVGFNTGGVSEGVEHGVTGLLSPEKDIEQLANNLLTLLKSNPLRAKFSSAGVERTNRLFNIKWQCQILESIYQELC
jgi:glycosyltransferase involved in cell wall biosynthesis